MIEQLTEKQFLLIDAEWDAMNPDANLFATHRWIRIWLAHFGNEQHAILTYRVHGVLQAGVLFRIHGGVYEQDHEQFPWPWIAARSELENPYAPFLEHLRGVRGVRKINFIQAPKEAARAVQSTRGYYHLANLARNSRAIDVSMSFVEYEKALKKKVRAELHRRDRHLHEAIPSATLVRHDNPAEALAIVHDVECDSWKEHEHTAIISSPIDIHFYRELMSIRDPAMSPRLYSLDSDDGHIAYVIGIFYGGVLYALKTSFQEAHAKLSPGSVLFYRVIEEICTSEPDVLRVELLGNDAQWKRHLANCNRELYDYLLLRNSLQNRAYVFAWTKVRPAVKSHPVLGPMYQRVRKRLQPDS